MIRVRALQKVYPGATVALRHIDLEIAAGEFVALIGPSGAGKSSFLRCLNGLIAPTAGEVEMDGEPVTGATGERLRRIRARIGFVFQQFHLLRRLTVLENALIGRLGHVPQGRSLVGWFPVADIARAKATLQRVGLGGLWGRRVPFPTTVPALMTVAATGPPAATAPPTVIDFALRLPPAATAEPTFSGPALTSPPIVTSAPAVTGPAVTFPPAVSEPPTMTSPEVRDPVVSDPPTVTGPAFMVSAPPAPPAGPIAPPLSIPPAPPTAPAFTVWSAPTLSDSPAPAETLLNESAGELRENPWLLAASSISSRFPPPTEVGPPRRSRAPRRARRPCDGAAEAGSAA